MPLEDAINRLSDVLERLIPAVKVEVETPEKPAKAAARNFKTRAEVKTAITPEPVVRLHEAVDDPECTNNYQTLFRKFELRPFTLDQASLCFKQGSAMESLKILRHLQREKLAIPINEDMTDWILERQ